VPYRVILTRQAAADLTAVRAWHGRGGMPAKARVAHILSAIRELSDAPSRWPRDDREPSLRMRIVEGHRIRFLVDEGAGTVVIVRVRGPWQDLP